MSAAGPKCVFLWASPRSMSTAFTKCMSAVDGVQIWHEPYQFTYHREKFASLAASSDPAAQLILQLQAATPNVTQQVEAVETPKGNLIDDSLFEYPWLKEQLETADEDKDLIFVKDLAYLVHGKYDYLPTEREYRHTFLIRDPHHVYKSMRKMFMDNTPEEYRTDFDMRQFPLYDAHRIFQYTHALWKHVKANLGSDPVIIDAADLGAHPEKILPKYFEAIGVPWREDYLTWDASSDVPTSWKTAERAFIRACLAVTHREALESTKFVPGASELPSRDDMTDDVIACIDEAMPYYSEMYEQRMKP